MIQGEMMDYARVAGLLPYVSPVFSKVEEYRGYGVSRVSDYYFAIPAGEGAFDLAKYKRKGYEPAFLAKTRHELRQIIDAHPLADKINAVPEQMSKALSGYWPQLLDFSIRLWGIPLGTVRVAMGEDSTGAGNLYLGKFSLRPFKLLRTVTKDNLGLDWVSHFQGDHFLPIFFEQNTPAKIKNGKSGQQIIYHHDQLFMERRGYQEDIFEDTRDPVSWLAWLLHQDYDQTTTVKSTVNISRDIYEVQGEVNHPDGRTVRLNLILSKADAGQKAFGPIPIEIYLSKQQGWWKPILFKIKLGILELHLS